MAEQISPPVNPPFSAADHDLLIAVNTNVSNLTQTVQGYMSNKQAKDDKVDERQREHQTRLDQLEGAISLLKWIIGLVVVLGAAAITYVGTNR